MTILLAPDSFKDALSALEACKAMEWGVKRALPSARVRLFPMADGGEGTAEVLSWHLYGELVEVTVSDPLLRPVKAKYCKSGTIAFVEMAEASGLQLLRLGERNPLKTSTFGTGELLAHAINNGAEEVYLAIGGSATNDAGMGMAMALGWQFLDENGVQLSPIGENLLKVNRILPPNPKTFPIGIGDIKPKWTVLCDVTNPLYGSEGAAQVFAKQKGADEATIERLDEGLRHFSEVVVQQLGKDYSKVPGAGAAGGLGFGAMAFLGASLQSGAETIMQLADFESVVKDADLIITGEGRLDIQTAKGKLVAAVCQKAQRHGVPVVAICGSVDADEADLYKIGLKAAFQIRGRGEPLALSIARTSKALEDLTYKVLKTMQL